MALPNHISSSELGILTIIKGDESYGKNDICQYISFKYRSHKFKDLDENYNEHNTKIHSTYVTENKESFFGSYQALDQSKLSNATSEEISTVTTIADAAKKKALSDIIIFPVIMLVSYLLLILYFRTKGGYQAVVLKQETVLT